MEERVYFIKDFFTENAWNIVESVYRYNSDLVALDKGLSNILTLCHFYSLSKTNHNRNYLKYKLDDEHVVTMTFLPLKYFPCNFCCKIFKLLLEKNKPITVTDLKNISDICYKEYVGEI